MNAGLYYFLGQSDGALPIPTVMTIRLEDFLIKESGDGWAKE
jgi:hypothetical protein